MKKVFLKPSDINLTKVSKKVTQKDLYSKGILKNISLMVNTLLGERKEKKKGVGLAAPQIGVLKRIILVDVKANGKKSARRRAGDFRVYINPEIIWKSKRVGQWYEGCFSTGNVCGIVSRSSIIKIRGFMIETLGVRSLPPPRWDFVKEKWSGYVAWIFQHEIDHLDGKVFLDHIKDPDKLHWVEENEFQEYRKSWKTWSKKCSFARWRKVKKPLL